MKNYLLLVLALLFVSTSAMRMGQGDDTCQIQDTTFEHESGSICGKHFKMCPTYEMTVEDCPGKTFRNQ